jgi:hypothetical protein
MLRLDALFPIDDHVLTEINALVTDVRARTLDKRSDLILCKTAK